jgi:putative FmdB family regulatory protein
MPTYEYECLSCGHRFEKLQRFSEDPEKVCPDCGCEVRRVIFPVGVIFKGSGWYITDSKKPQPVGTAAPSEEKPVDEKAAAAEMIAKADGNGKKDGPKDAKKDATKTEAKGDKALSSKAAS